YSEANPCEMIGPKIDSRIEEWNDSTRPWYGNPIFEYCNPRTDNNGYSGHSCPFVNAAQNDRYEKPPTARNHSICSIRTDGRHVWQSIVGVACGSSCLGFDTQEHHGLQLEQAHRRIEFGQGFEFFALVTGDRPLGV